MDVDVEEEAETDAADLRGFRRRWAFSHVGSADFDGVTAEATIDGIPDTDDLFGADMESTPFSDSGFEIAANLESTGEIAPSGGTPPLSPQPSSVSYVPSIGPPVITSLEIIMHDCSGTESAWKSKALEAVSKRAKAFQAKQLWEMPGLNGVFGPADRLQGTILANSSNLFLPTQVGLHDVLNTKLGTVVSDEQVVENATVPASTLKYARRELPDEDVRRAALDRLRSLLVLDSSATRLGVSLQQIADSTSSPDLVEQSVRDCFRAKASSTLQKRAASLWRLSKLLWLVGAESPFDFTEEQLYNCLCNLRATGAGATSAQHIIEALWFIDGTAKFVKLNLAMVISGRCKGVARDMYLSKSPLQQKQPLMAEHVRVLERMMRAVPSRDQCIIGQILLCIHACCRWKDAQRIKHVSLERGDNEVLVYCEALSSKTSLTAESQTRFLPYVALGTGIIQDDWAALWLGARQREGLVFDDYSLPSFSERRGDWTDAPMSSSEATCFMRDYLLEAGVSRDDLANYGSHSCKTTILTWAGRSTLVTFSQSERRQLGHHMKPGTKSVLTYSREAYTTLYGKVLAMFKTMRNGTFDPDLPAVQRVIQTANDVGREGMRNPVEPMDTGDNASDSDSSLGSEIDMQQEVATVSHEEFHKVKPFGTIPAKSLVVHRVSGIVHVANEDGFLVCGRRPSANFMSYLDGESDHPNLESCAQCRKALKSRHAGV